MEQTLKTEKVNFWDYYKSLPKRQKNGFKLRFIQLTGMKKNTLDCIMQRKNFNFTEYETIASIINIPAENLEFTNPQKNQ